MTQCNCFESDECPFAVLETAKEKQEKWGNGILTVSCIVQPFCPSILTGNGTNL